MSYCPDTAMTNILVEAEERGRAAALAEVRQRAEQYHEYCWQRCQETRGSESLHWIASANAISAVIRAIKELSEAAR